MPVVTVTLWSDQIDAAHLRWHFDVATEKAARHGVKVETIARNLAMGGYRPGDVKRGKNLDPTCQVMQLPFSARFELGRLANLPIPAENGTTFRDLGLSSPTPWY